MDGSTHRFYSGSLLGGVHCRMQNIISLAKPQKEPQWRLLVGCCPDNPWDVLACADPPRGLGCRSWFRVCPSSPETPQNNSVQKKKFIALDRARDSWIKFLHPYVVLPAPLYT